MSDNLDALQRKFAAIALRDGSKGESFAAFLDALKEVGVSESAIEEAQAIGSKLFKKTALPRSIKALAGGLAASQGADEIFDVAKASAQNIPDSIITSEWRTALAKLRKTDPTMATALAKAPTDIVHRAVRGGGFTGGPTPPPPSVGGPLAVRSPSGGPLATLPKAVRPVEKVVEIAGTVAKKAGRGKGILGGLILNTLLPFGSDSPLTTAGRGGRARNAAVEGFAAMGATSSGAVLSSIVRQQELASRRQMVLQQFEPEVFEKMLVALATNDMPEVSLTDTERRIGGAYEEPLPARKPDKDVKFLVDQLFSEMSGQF